MKSLQDFQIFLYVCKTSSLSSAAKGLNVSPAVASAAIKRLEAELGATLLVRTTRTLRLTPEGEIFQRHCAQAVELLTHSYEALSARKKNIHGTLRISIPSDLGRHVLWNLLDSFQVEHPEINLHIEISDRLTNVYKEPIDLAIRYGTLPDSNLVAFSLVPDNRRVLCASPAYLARAGHPLSPTELTTHNCLCYMLDEKIYDRWIFLRDGQEISVSVNGHQTTNDGEVVRRWALAGRGIAYKSKLDVADDLDAGKLIQLCPDWLGETSPLSFMCVNRHQLSPTIQALRLYLKERLSLRL